MLIETGSGAIDFVFGYAYSFLSNFFNGLLLYVLALIVSAIIFAVFLIILVIMFVYMFGWGERKIIARIQSRHGPSYVGKFGILQNMADVIKLLSKQAPLPKKADKLIFLSMLPVVYALFVFMLFFIPITKFFVGISSSISLIIVFALLSISPTLIFLAGWSSGNKYSSISAQRSSMVLVGYEMPMLIVVASIAILSHSFSLANIVEMQQGLWYCLLLPIGFFVFFVTMLAELERPPFDVREADNELIAGWLTDVSAPYYALALFLDYTRLFFGTLLISVLFLGGWLGPSFLPPFAWIIIKVVLLTIFIIIVRATTVRMKIDRMIKIGWLYLLPLSVLNLALALLFVFK
ncbi:MAG: complex I subunit 1 family protein [Candidatus Micrarchaeaceae archaeon]